MKTYKVKVNGKSYIVELESVEETQKSITTNETKSKKEEKKVSTSSECNEILAPIQGVVIDVKTSIGQKVKKGDILLLIEAMKLENEVNASVDGEVVEILVTKGQNVSTNEVLIKIK